MSTFAIFLILMCVIAVCVFFGTLLIRLGHLAADALFGKRK
jgi:prolipoprotein diacylglyceryltransferase